MEEKKEEAGNAVDMGRAFSEMNYEQKMDSMKKLLAIANDDDMMEWDFDEYRLLMAVVGYGIIRWQGATGIIDTIKSLVWHGPCWAGDVPSKSDRDGLITAGLAFQTLVKGEHGFTAASLNLCRIATACNWVPKEQKSETGHSIYDIENPDEAIETLDRLLSDCHDADPEGIQGAAVYFLAALELVTEKLQEGRNT